MIRLGFTYRSFVSHKILFYEPKPNITSNFCNRFICPIKLRNCPLSTLSSVKHLDHPILRGIEYPNDKNTLTLDSISLHSSAMNSSSNVSTNTNPSILKESAQINLLKAIQLIPNRVQEIIDKARDEKAYSGDIDALSSHSGLFIRQLKLEEEQQNEAVQAYQESLQRLLTMGKGTSLKQIQKIVLKWYEPLCEALIAERNEITKNFSGHRDKYGAMLFLLPVDKLSVITIDTVLTSVLQVGNAGASLTRLAFNIGHIIENEVNITKLKDGKNRKSFNPYDNELILKAAANKRYAMTMQYRINQLLDEASWPLKSKIRLGALLISLLLQVARTYDGITRAFEHSLDYVAKVKKNYGVLRLESTLYKEIATRDFAEILPLYLPMLVEPQEWDQRKKHFGSCYYRLRSDLVRTFSKYHIAAIAKANMRPVLDGLNFLGKLRWKINRNILNVVNNAWERRMVIGELPPQDDIPLPAEADYWKLVKRPKQIPPEHDNGVGSSSMSTNNMSTNNTSTSSTSTGLSSNDIEYEEVMVFHEKEYQQTVRRVNTRNSELHSLRCDYKLKLKIAEKFKDDPIYFPWNLDFRGRAYPIPQNLSHIGSDLCRGLLLFDTGKALGAIGFYWLKVHLANLYGNNKISSDDRVKWVDENMNNIYDSAYNPLDGKLWWKDADEPFQCLATCMEICAAIESGDPISYISHLPIHQDGSCNGLQHYAALGRDELGGRAVNLIPSESGDKPQDVYSKVLAIVLTKIDRDADRYQQLIEQRDNLQNELAQLEPSTNDMSNDKSDVDKDSKKKILDYISVEIDNLKFAPFLKGIVNRKVIKQTVMTSVYGVTAIGARAQIQSRLQDIFAGDLSTIASREMETKLFRAAGYIARLTLDSLSEMFESAQAIKEWLATAARLVATQGQVMSWITPLGLPVIQPYRKAQAQRITASLQTFTLAVSDDNLPVSKTKQGSAISPNFVHSLDASHMIMTALKMKERNLCFTAVHDSFWTHACDIPVLNEVLRDCFVELYEKPVLENLRDSLVMRYPDAVFPPLPERGSLDITKVRQSKYFFH